MKKNLDPTAQSILNSLKRYSHFKKLGYKTPYDCLGIAPNSRLAYSQGWDKFMKFCQSKGLVEMPATTATIVKFLKVESKTSSQTTINGIYLSAIRKTHKINRKHSKIDELKINEVVKDLRRQNPRRKRQVAPVLISDLLKIIGLHKQPSPIIRRDMAMLSVGFAGALRRSEICNLKFNDIEFIDKTKGFLNIRQSKTDQAGLGFDIPIVNGTNFKPLTILKNYINVNKIKDGWLFRAMKKGGGVLDNPMHNSDVSRIIKFYVEKIGLDPTKYSGHSLRSGLITSAAKNNARLDKIMEVSRHKTPAVVMEYIRDANQFDNHVGAKF